MKQADLGLNLTAKRTRKRAFLDEMNRLVPWADLVTLVTPFAPEGRRGRPPFAVETMLRLHFIQQWFGLSDPAMEEKHKLVAQIRALINDMLRDKGLMLRAGTAVDVTLIAAAPSSTKNAGGQRDPETHQTKKGNQWHFGIKAHIGADAESGLVHTVRGTAANVNDVVEANSLLHGDETDAFEDAGYQGAHRRANRGLKKNTAQLTTLFALSNLWMARGPQRAENGHAVAAQAADERSNGSRHPPLPSGHHTCMC